MDIMARYPGPGLVMEGVWRDWNATNVSRTEKRRRGSTANLRMRPGPAETVKGLATPGAWQTATLSNAPDRRSR